MVGFFVVEGMIFKGDCVFGSLFVCFDYDYDDWFNFNVGLCYDCYCLCGDIGFNVCIFIFGIIW